MTAYSGLFDGVHGDGYALQVGRSPLNKKVGRVLNRRSMTRIREAIDTVALGAKYNAVTVTLPNDSLEYTDTDATVVVNHTAHGFNTGDQIIIAGATVVTGLTSGQVNGLRTITVTNANEYTFEAEAAAGATDATAGGSAITITSNKGSTSYKRVQGTVDPGNPVVQGGAITIEDVTQVASEATVTSADVAAIDDIVNFDSQPASYPVDLSGNGGGDKLKDALGA